MIPIKQNRSWSKPDKVPGLIAIKKVDWSIFEYGSHIPLNFHEDFAEANDDINIELGEGKNVELLIKETSFDARLVNIDRKQVDYDTYQLRYDSNNELKEFLRRKFKTSYNFLKAQRDKEENTRKQHTLPENISEYMEFYDSGEPLKYKVKLVTTESSDSVIIWWVNQGKSNKKKDDKSNLWAPIENQNGNNIWHWDTMKEVEVGDIILHYSNGALRYVSKALSTAKEKPKPESLAGNKDWNEVGRLIELDHYELNPVIELYKFNDQLKELNISKGPINVKGEVNQGYLFRFNKEGLVIIQQSQPETNWPEFALMGRDIGHADIEINIQATINNITDYISSKGFTYPEGLIENFYLSLKTKPFVLLAGVSGTGKTKLVKLFAEAIGCTDENGQFKMISVRPDWSDSSDLLGYKNIRDTFQPGPMIEVLQNAVANPNDIYFVCLDEMNLARVEYYFSDFLSIMETRRINQEGRILTSCLLDEDDFVEPDDKDKYAKLIIPDNLYIVGTVNMDETTHPFSKKVLDRANTIELSEINLLVYGLSDDEDDIKIDTGRISNEFLKSDYLTLNNCSTADKAIIKEVVEDIQKINDILEEASLQIGYRIRDEFCFYMIYNEHEALIKKDQAFDFQLMQKILPRIQGSSRSIKNVLIKLYNFTTDENLSVKEGEVGDIAIKTVEEFKEGKNNAEIKYPISAEKIATMIKRIEEDGFTAYWI